MTRIVDAPFSYFGGKRKVAPEVWARFGDVQNYVEPFFGSGAVLFGRPTAPGTETVNDVDGYVANFWRAVQHAPDDTAEHADWPVNENDLHARHVWLVAQRETLRQRLEGDPDFYDAKIAGWWVWGLCCWIGGVFCSGQGPWHSVDGKLVHLGNDGWGVKRQLVHLGNGGQGVNRPGVRLRPWFAAIAARLTRVRVCSGDWSRVCGPSVTFTHGLTGVFLDPPYADNTAVYRVDSESVAHEVREWCVANGDNPLLRIALCGYEGEHEMPATWTVHAWNAGGGFARERIWFSPACLDAHQTVLDFGAGKRVRENA